MAEDSDHSLNGVASLVGHAKPPSRLAGSISAAQGAFFADSLPTGPEEDSVMGSELRVEGVSGKQHLGQVEKMSKGNIKQVEAKTVERTQIESRKVGDKVGQHAKMKSKVKEARKVADKRHRRVEHIRQKAQVRAKLAKKAEAKSEAQKHKQAGRGKNKGKSSSKRK